MLLITDKQIHKRMLQFPRACAKLLRHFKLPSQHLEYVVTKVCKRIVNSCANAMHDIMV